MKPLLHIVVLAIFQATPLFAQTPWIHVEVDERAESGAHINVNLPLSVVQVALEAAPDRIVSNGKFHLSHVNKDLDVEDLRKMWMELREAGDAEFVTVEDDNETVRVRRDGDFIRVDVKDRHGDDPDEVHVEIPVTVVDALFSGEGETLNIEDALEELRDQRGDIVRADDGDTKVRVWIDER